MARSDLVGCQWPFFSLTYCFVRFINYKYSVGYGDICPGKLSLLGKIFLVLFSMASLGTFCGPVMDLASSWRSQVPGSLFVVAGLVLGTGVVVFSVIEGLSQSEAIYASVITGK